MKAQCCSCGLRIREVQYRKRPLLTIHRAAEVDVLEIAEMSEDLAHHRFRHMSAYVIYINRQRVRWMLTREMQPRRRLHDSRLNKNTKNASISLDQCIHTYRSINPMGYTQNSHLHVFRTACVYELIWDPSNGMHLRFGMRNVGVEKHKLNRNKLQYSWGL